MHFLWISVQKSMELVKYFAHVLKCSVCHICVTCTSLEPFGFTIFISLVWSETVTWLDYICSRLCCGYPYWNVPFSPSRSMLSRVEGFPSYKFSAVMTNGEKGGNVPCSWNSAHGGWKYSFILRPLSTRKKEFVVRILWLIICFDIWRYKFHSSLVCIRVVHGIFPIPHNTHPMPHWYAFYSSWYASDIPWVCIRQLMVCIRYPMGMHSTAHGMHPISHWYAFDSSWYASGTSLVCIRQLMVCIRYLIGMNSI
jgi:hypothetical protein